MTLEFFGLLNGLSHPLVIGAFVLSSHLDLILNGWKVFGGSLSWVEQGVVASIDLNSYTSERLVQETSHQMIMGVEQMVKNLGCRLIL